jgi:hypothetical protein
MNGFHELQVQFLRENNLNVSHTQVVIQGKLVVIPYLNDQSGWDPEFCLVNAPEMLLK